MDKKSQDEKPRAKHTEVTVDTLPKCDFCDSQASYDGKTRMGPWANMCEADFMTYGIGLGLGRGQRLILKGKPQDKEEGATPVRRPRNRRLLNDIFRQSLGLIGSGRVVITQGVDGLPEETKVRILLAVRDFKDFNDDNDPYGEHDFGSLTIDGHELMWKIDTYDTEYRYHGDANRVLTIMLAHEY